MFKTLLVSATLAQTAFAAVQSLGSGGQCLQVSGTPAENSNVVLGSCNSANSQQTSTGQQWIISEGNNANGVQLFGTNFCLDAQTSPAPGRQVVIATCQQNPSQIWYLTGDNRVAITGGTQCLSASGSNAETQNCAPNVASEAWEPTFLFDETAASSSASSSANASSTASGVAGGVAGGAASSAASGASAATSGASAAVGSGASAVSGATSAAASGASAAVSGASGAAATATSGAGSVAGDATSAAGQATSGAGSVAGDATSAVGAATSAAGSAAGQATSAAALAAGGGSSAGFSKITLAPLSAILGVAIGAICIL
ncbi:uncharacterized protein I303_106342 [Kwoniella dejecticola CBS 10117]|uniref:Ricin B lectin domain-containing protein n=1 Tax=Kwoniella dejecticola CBS 10117 TaxID=1296121 RepID=A0A1A5ZV01_9TREE|nr:uncharacterized protein I303_08401 [Kwoniella dejecticola CBS 10117]OBR81630.1 hypothetical protein I303_08401 [Kwoniella dejecticola CBS 10117]